MCRMLLGVTRGNANPVRRSLRSAAPDTSPGRPGGGFGIVQGSGFGVHPSLNHQCFTQARGPGQAVADRAAVIVMASDGALHGIAPHQRRQGIRSRHAAVVLRRPAALANHSARRRNNAFQSHDLLADPQRIAVEHHQPLRLRRHISGRRCSGGCIRWPDDQHGHRQKPDQGACRGQQDPGRWPRRPMQSRARPEKSPPAVQWHGQTPIVLAPLRTSCVQASSSGV